MPGSHSPSPEPRSRSRSFASSSSPSPHTPRSHRADPFDLGDRLADSMLHSASPTAAGTPAAPAGLVISKAGIEASTRGDKLTGILCLKITLPKDSDGHPQRWSLFNGPRPKLRSIPALYPLPASLALSSTSSHIAKAAALLQLPPAGAYPPPPSEGGSGQLRPYIDVSKATDQVFIVLDGSPPGGQAKRRSSIGSRARSEWLVVIEFETDIEEDTSGGDTWYKAYIATPKCLENFIRFEIAPKDETSAQSAEIVTTPRVHPLPASVFDAHDPIHTTPTKRRKFEDGWEDGEVPGTASSDGTHDEDDDDSSWLHGRFQSTDVMALQWGFAPALGTPPDLRVAPHWDAGQPSIDVTYEAVIASIPGPFGLEAMLPPGWGWSDLQIRADGLFSWRSADLNGLGALVSATATQPDDTMSTIDALSPTLGSPAAMPKLAALDAADFSFELNSFNDEKPSVPTTPSLRRIERHGGSALKVVPRVPTPAAVFELEFEQGDDDDDERVLLVNGTLVPLPMTLVSPDAPVSIPFFRFDDASLPGDCQVQCPQATLAHPVHTEEGAETLLCDTTVDSVGTFLWADDEGEVLPPRPAASVKGTVKVVVQRNIWGLQTVSMMVPWPGKAEEMTIGFSTPAAAVRVVRASARGSPLPHALIAREEEGLALADLRVGGGRGSVEIVLEIAEDNGVALPVFAGASGELRVELLGDGWDKLLAVQPISNLTSVSDYAFTGDLAELPFIMFAPPPVPEVAPAAPHKPSRTRRLVSRLVSWNVLVNLVFLWILGSLAGQVARLRAELAFVADETRDLRLYGFERPKLRDYERERAWEDERVWERAADSATVTVTVLSSDTTQRPAGAAGAREGSSDDSHGDGVTGPDTDTSLSHRDTGEYGLGRVVFDGGRWGALFNHPSVRAVTDTVSRLWHTLLWLIAA